MSIVSEDSLERAKDLRKKALVANDYRNGYDYAIRGLELAIAALEQIKEITENVSVKTNITLIKEG